MPTVLSLVSMLRNHSIQRWGLFNTLCLAVGLIKDFNPLCGTVGDQLQIVYEAIMTLPRFQLERKLFLYQNEALRGGSFVSGTLMVF